MWAYAGLDDLNQPLIDLGFPAALFSVSEVWHNTTLQLSAVKPAHDVTQLL